MSIVRDLVQTVDGFLVLAENANPSHEYVCPTCAQKLNSRTIQDNRFFSHLRGESQACRLAIPKTNYHRVLTKCQNRDNWRLHVECATPACKQEVEGPYHVSREGAYRIIVRALRTHEYHVKAGCARFKIQAVFCDACTAIKGGGAPPPPTPPRPAPTTIAYAESVAAQATTTRRAAELSANAALDQHADARARRVVAEQEEKEALEQHQTASQILAAATTTEREAIANVNRVRVANNAAAELERQRVAASEAAAQAARVQAFEENAAAELKRQRVAASEAAALERVRERVKAARVQAFEENAAAELKRQRVAASEAENVAPRERERVAFESGVTENAPVQIIDLTRQNVTGELGVATRAINAYVDAFNFNLSGTHPDVRVWVTRGITSGPLEVSFPRMTTTFGVRSANGFDTNPRVHKNLDLNLTNPLIAELVTSMETRLLQFVLNNRVTIFGREMTDQAVREMFHSVIRPLPLHFRRDAYSSFVRVKIAPTQQVTLLAGERVNVGVGDIRPGDDVVVTVKLVPYIAGAYFEILCVCTHALLYTNELKNLERQTRVDGETTTLEREVIEATTRLRVHADREAIADAAFASERQRVLAETEAMVEAEAEAREHKRAEAEAEAREHKRAAAEAEAREHERAEAEAEAREHKRAAAEAEAREHKRAEAEAREHERAEAEAREAVAREREQYERAAAEAEAREHERVEAENARREHLAVAAAIRRAEAENAEQMASRLVALERNVRTQIDAERAERTRLRVETERRERAEGEAAVGERVRAAAEAQDAERVQAAIDATRANLAADLDWKMPNDFNGIKDA